MQDSSPPPPSSAVRVDPRSEIQILNGCIRWPPAGFRSRRNRTGAGHAQTSEHARPATDRSLSPVKSFHYQSAPFAYRLMPLHQFQGGGGGGGGAQKVLMSVLERKVCGANGDRSGLVRRGSAALI
jgi:hypothetical protein